MQFLEKQLSSVNADIERSFRDGNYRPTVIAAAFQFAPGHTPLEKVRVLAVKTIVDKEWGFVQGAYDPKHDRSIAKAAQREIVEEAGILPKHILMTIPIRSKAGRAAYCFEDKLVPGHGYSKGALYLPTISVISEAASTTPYPEEIEDAALMSLDDFRNEITRQHNAMPGTRTTRTNAVFELAYLALPSMDPSLILN